MAKMFYSLEEAAQRLGKSTGEVQHMAETGQVQEFRDRDKLMFKKEQIDLLAGGGEDDDITPIGLADSGEREALQDKEESVLGLVDSRESTGISIFDSDDLENADPSEVTQVTESLNPTEFSVDPGGSGSGLLDLTREADDTSLGAVLDDIYAGDEDAAAQSGGSTGLFATPTPAGADVGPAMVPMMAQVYDGGGSGLTIGLAIGAIICLLLSILVVFTALAGDQTVAGIANALGANLWMYVGIAGGGTIVAGIIGWFVGKTFQ